MMSDYIEKNHIELTRSEIIELVTQGYLIKVTEESPTNPTHLDIITLKLQEVPNELN